MFVEDVHRVGRGQGWGVGEGAGGGEAAPGREREVEDEGEVEEDRDLDQELQHGEGQRLEADLSTYLLSGGSEVGKHSLDITEPASQYFPNTVYIFSVFGLVCKIKSLIIIKRSSDICCGPAQYCWPSRVFCISTQTANS